MFNKKFGDTSQTGYIGFKHGIDRDMPNKPFCMDRVSLFEFLMSTHQH